jgi:transketolase
MNDSRQFAKNAKISALKMVAKAKSSHIGSCFSMADIMAVLYSKFVPDGRLYISKGHAAAIVYASLAEAGIIEKHLLDGYSQNGQSLAGHINHDVEGIELSTGSLGHALPVALGSALAARFHAKDTQHYVILSDGECDEGSNWEAILLAPHLKLGQLTVIVDYNKIQSFGRVEEVLQLEPFADKWRACNWNVIEVNGHDHEAVTNALKQAKEHEGQPTVLLAHTVKGKGVSFMEDKLLWHYKSPDDELLHKAIAEIEKEYA